MRVERGASQILFGLLPGQTADLEGRIWRVSRWVDPVATALDQDSVAPGAHQRDRPVGVSRAPTTASPRT